MDSHFRGNDDEIAGMTEKGHFLVFPQPAKHSGLTEHVRERGSLACFGLGMGSWPSSPQKDFSGLRQKATKPEALQLPCAANVSEIMCLEVIVAKGHEGMSLAG
jgi:hypothetical protein